MDLLKEVWPYILAGVAVMAWALRVEHQTKANASEIRRLWHQRSEDQASAKEARDATNRMLEEVRSDIKQLLRKAGA